MVLTHKQKYLLFGPSKIKTTSRGKTYRTTYKSCEINIVSIINYMGLENLLGNASSFFFRILGDIFEA